MSDDNSPRWQVAIMGDQHDSDDVAAILESQGYVLQKHDDKPYLSGPPLENEPTAGDALNAVERVLQDMNALRQLTDTGHKPVTVAGTVRDGDTEHGILRPETIAMSFETRAALADAGQDNQRVQIERASRWLAAIDKCPAVREMTELLKSDRDNKYHRALELIIQHRGRDKLQAWQVVGCSSRKDFYDVMATLNVLRHENPNYTPRMSLSAAKSRASLFVQAWLDHKSQRAS